MQSGHHDPAQTVERTYIALTLLTTLAASLIWGINTIFLLDAGLNNVEAFAANAFFTLGMVAFEVPTGVVADTRGRRFSYVLGGFTLVASTLLYFAMWQLSAPFWGWAIASILIGLGFTFFSGATEAWLVDALKATGFTGHLEHVFGRAQIATGIAMLTGTVAGGLIAQVTNLGVPYLVRAGLLVVSMLVALRYMRDIGFTPQPSASPVQAVRDVLGGAIDGGLRNPPVRWVMLAAPFTAGAGIYIFYAAQPFLLELYGDPSAYGIAGLAAAIFAGCQIAGGLLVNRVRRLFRRRTDGLLAFALVAVSAVALLGWTDGFAVALLLLSLSSLVNAMRMPMRSAYVNGLIPSEQRATVLSFDSLMASSGGVVAQPVLGRVADLSGYGPSYVVAAAIQALAVPFILLARRERAASDPIAGT
ncbi:MAG TPA: MFS transporter [candidate division Zixibacteria bacterium]|nr:MFS transporter [candidate division Zixibacteria bacterium]